LEGRIAERTAQLTAANRKLKQQRLAPGSRECLKAIEGNLNGLAASSVRKLSDDLINLTPAELQVAGLIMMDKATKEIAEDLNLSPKTVEYHRYNLRRKLGLGKRKVNLRTYLKTIP
jgi:DNA-binding CsgD family transcriptional regulator